MKARRGVQGAMAAAVLALWPGSVQAQNNTPATAAEVQVNQGWMLVNMDAGSNTQRWYKYPVIAGRSYCVEGVSEAAPVAPHDGINDGETNVFQGDGTTLIYRNDEQLEPGGGGAFLTPGRVCYIAPATEANLAKVGNFTFMPEVKSYRWRIVETTLFCPWFFSGSGFEAFILIRNTTSQPVAATIALRNTAGIVLGTRSATVPANGSFNLQVSAPPPNGFGLPSASGNVEIAYGTAEPLGTNSGPTSSGSPGALIANLTSLSFSGVSFDTPFSPRVDWTR